MAVIGTSAAAAGAYLAKLGTDYQTATGQIAAATGTTGKELESLQNVMRDVYGDNFGENMEDVANAISTVNQQMKGLSDTELKSVTEGAFVLRDTFEYDVAESIRAANAVVNNFGVSGEEAMNLIATGAQNGLDFSGELLDTISEYSVQFAKVGLDADQMFQIIQAGADSGAWNLDKVGDAIKEMSIRVVDGSDTTAEGFKAIGLNADVMAQQFAAGGESAQQAFRDTIAGLASMEDPVQQNIAGVNLFGTMWEDLGPDVVAQLASITDEAYSAGDELAKMSQVKYDNLGAAITGIWRQVEAELMPIANTLTGFLTNALGNINLDGLGEWLQSALSGVASYLEPILSPLQKIMESIFSGGLLQDFLATLKPILGPLQELATTLMEGIGGALDGLGPLFDGVQVAIGGIMDVLGPVLDGLSQAAEIIFPEVISIGNKMGGIFTEVVGTLTPMLEPLGSLVGSLFPALAAVIGYVVDAFLNFYNMILPIWQVIMNAIMPVINGIIGALKSLMDFITNVFTGNWKGAWEAVVSFFGSIWDSLVGLIKMPFNGVIGTINNAIRGINSISVDIPDWVPLLGGRHLGFSIPEIPLLATGGTITQPMLAVVGDAPETIVPHGNNSRNRALLGEAAAGVGVPMGGSITVNFNVTITGGDANSVRQGILDAEEEFERRMETWLAKQRRIAYS